MNLFHTYELFKSSLNYLYIIYHDYEKKMEK